MIRFLIVLFLVAPTFVDAKPKEDFAQFPSENQIFYLVGVVQSGKRKTNSLRVDRPAISPCDNDAGDVLKRIDLWGENALSRFVGKRIVTSGYIICPNSGIAFVPNEAQIFEVY
jgi:hypothetical protein